MIVEAGALQRRATGGRNFTRLATRNPHAAPVPEVGMQQHWQVGGAHAADQSVESGGVVVVAVTAHDRFDVPRIDLQTVHVGDHAVRD